MESSFGRYNRARVDDRLVTELIGMARGFVADGRVTHEEAEYLDKWLVANSVVSFNPVIKNLLTRLREMLSDGEFDASAAKNIFEMLHSLAGGDFESGEIAKSTTLPLDDPPPQVVVENHRFCFTGTFAFGSHPECESVVTKRGGVAGALTRKTNYLVIGTYATDSWIQSSYGRKIESAIEMRSRGCALSIISEQYWLQSIGVM